MVAGGGDDGTVVCGGLRGGCGGAVPGGGDERLWHRRGIGGEFVGDAVDDHDNVDVYDDGAVYDDHDNATDDVGAVYDDHDNVDVYDNVYDDGAGVGV